MLRQIPPMAHARPPISSRHAFALAFDLAVRRDPLQSLWIPVLLHTPWIAMQAMLPAPDEAGGLTRTNLLLNSVVLIGDALVSLWIAGMLRFRAGSVFNTPLGTRPASVLQCYGKSFTRLPWLFVTELLRNIAMFGAGLFLVLPGVWVGFRLSLATEAAVLREGNAFDAFGRSFDLTPGRLERWLEMIAISVAMVLTLLFTCALFYLALPSTSWSTWVTVALVLMPFVMTVIQYAWTFFYLRLEEIDMPQMAELRPVRAHVVQGGGSSSAPAPKLRLVESADPDSSEP